MQPGSRREAAATVCPTRTRSARLSASVTTRPTTTIIASPLDQSRAYICRGPLESDRARASGRFDSYGYHLADEGQVRWLAAFQASRDGNLAVAPFRAAVCARDFRKHSRARPQTEKRPNRDQRTDPAR